MAESIGERRAGGLLKGNLAVAQAQKATNKTGGVIALNEQQRLSDAALQTALDNFRESENLGLLYSRFEAHRCLAVVHFYRGEYAEAERLCAAASELVNDTESNVCKLWLGPLYFDVLLAAAKRADSEGKADEAVAKRRLAMQLSAAYQESVTRCQSPRFIREAERLAAALKGLTMALPS